MGIGAKNSCYNFGFAVDAGHVNQPTMKAEEIDSFPQPECKYRKKRMSTIHHLLTLQMILDSIKGLKCAKMLHWLS